MKAAASRMAAAISAKNGIVKQWHQRRNAFEKAASASGISRAAGMAKPITLPSQRGGASSMSCRGSGALMAAKMASKAQRNVMAHRRDSSNSAAAAAYVIEIA